MLLRLPAGDTRVTVQAARIPVFALGQVCRVDIAQEILDSCIGHMNVSRVQAFSPSGMYCPTISPSIGEYRPGRFRYTFFWRLMRRRRIGSRAGSCRPTYA